MIWQICDLEGVVCFNKSTHIGGPPTATAYITLKQTVKH